ncbi:AraC family transcriptional regulator [Paenibacillus chungangensis]
MEQEYYKVASNPFIPDTDSEPVPMQVLFAGESQTKPAHRLGPKVYDFYLMHIVLSGHGTYSAGGEQHRLGPGHTFLIRPEQLISYESDGASPWRYRWVAFRGDHIPLLLQQAGFASEREIAYLPDIRKAALLFHRIYEALRHGRPSASLQAMGSLHMLLASYSEALLPLSPTARHSKQKESDRLYQQVVHYLSTQYTHPVSIEAMAETLGYNRAYLSRLFKRQTGLSPVTFLLRLRLDKARHMLRERPELTIEQVAASVGIQDALYFSKQFRNIHGQSPTSYRQDMLNTPD